MLLAKKIRILPTPEQEVLLWKTTGAARWAHNYTVASKREEPDLEENVLRKRITQLKKTEEYSWLNDVGNEAIKQSVIDCFKSYKTRGRANFHKKDTTRPSFNVNYQTILKIDNFHVRCERLGSIKTAEIFPTLPSTQKHYSRPTISYDNKYWYISVCIETEVKSLEVKTDPVGIDLGIKNLAVVATDKEHVKTFNSINKTSRVKKLERKLRRYQRKLDRQRSMRPTGTELSSLKNYQKTKKKIQLIHRTLTNIRNNYLHQVTTWVVKTKPSTIVLEDLAVRNMMINRHLARAVQNQKFYTFRTMITYKAKMKSIPVILADRFLPSSKTCHNCGCVKRNLSLSDRNFTCEECGYSMNRDINAAMNLAHLANHLNP